MKSGFKFSSRRKKPSLKSQISDPAAGSVTELPRAYASSDTPESSIARSNSNSQSSNTMDEATLSDGQHDSQIGTLISIAPPRLSPMEYMRMYLLSKAKADLNKQNCVLERPEQQWYWTPRWEKFLIIPRIPHNVKIACRLLARDKSDLLSREISDMTNQVFGQNDCPRLSLHLGEMRASFPSLFNLASLETITDSLERSDTSSVRSDTSAKTALNTGLPVYYDAQSSQPLRGNKIMPEKTSECSSAFDSPRFVDRSSDSCRFPLTRFKSVDRISVQASCAQTPKGISGCKTSRVESMAASLLSNNTGTEDGSWELSVPSLTSLACSARSDMSARTRRARHLSLELYSSNMEGMLQLHAEDSNVGHLRRRLTKAIPQHSTTSPKIRSTPLPDSPTLGHYQEGSFSKFQAYKIQEDWRLCVPLPLKLPRPGHRDVGARSMTDPVGANVGVSISSEDATDLERQKRYVPQAFGGLATAKNEEIGTSTILPLVSLHAREAQHAEMPSRYILQECISWKRPTSAQRQPDGAVHNTALTSFDTASRLASAIRSGGNDPYNATHASALAPSNYSPSDAPPSVRSLLQRHRRSFSIGQEVQAPFGPTVPNLTIGAEERRSGRRSGGRRLFSRD